MKKYLFLSFVIIVGVYFIGCAASRPKKTAPQKKGGVNEVMEIQSKKEKQKAKNTAEEDEVLKLLGITPEEKKKAEATDTTSVVAEQKQLKAKIAQLEQELNSKNSEVGQLQTEMKAKENKLKKLEDMLISLKSNQQSSSYGESARPTKAQPARSTFKAKYEKVLQLYEKRQYKTAIQKFRQLLQENPNTSLSDNCQYWIGESYYSLGQYNQAIVEFEKVFTFPNSNKEDAAQLKIGMSYMKLGNKKRAADAFNTLIERYPKSEYIPLAKRLLNRL